MSTPTNVPPPLQDVARAVEQRMRDSFWDSTWESQLHEDLRKVLGTTRQEVVGTPDMSCCLGPQIERELAVCYLSPPTTTRDGAAPKLTEPRGPVAQALLWSLMPDFQGRVLWSREYVMRLEVTTNGGLLYRPVPGWLVDGDADPAHPDQFIRYLEWVPRSIPFLGGVADVDGTPEDVWTRDEINLTDPENPFLRVWDESGTVDLTEFVFGPAPDEGSRSQ
ncbi:MAG: hypothetical protein WC985_10145, partial [Thermoplasmata archaeon]